METTLIRYMLVSGVSLILLYSVYHIFFRKTTLFKLNRIYLLSCIVFSLLLPFITINISINDPQLIQEEIESTLTQGIIQSTNDGEHTLNWTMMFSYIYIIGVIFISLKLVISMIKILSLIIKNKSTKINGKRIILMNNELTHFSFLNLIFINTRYVDASNFEAIHTHETEHIKQKHFIDLIILEGLIIFQWFNPIVWIYNRNLKILHEYDADKAVISKDICDKANYLNILYNQVAKVNFHSLVNTFNNSLTKNRIIMITKNKTSRKSAFKLLIAVPLTLMLLGIFSINYVYSSTNEEQAVIVEEQVLPELNEPEPLPEIEKPIAELPTKPQSVAQSDTTVHFIVDVQPKFPGGEAERLKYLRENVKYPQESKDNNSSGTVYVQFVIEKDGSVSNVKLMRGVDEYIDKEAIRVISEMPKWTPGTDKKGNPLRVQFAMQIKFTLDASKNEDKKE